MTRVPLRIALALCAGLGSSTARGQFLDQPASAFAITPGTATTTVVSATPLVTPTRTMTRQERRAARQRARYQVMRPTYTSGPGITFAPLSDRYFPRTIWSRDIPATGMAPRPVVTTTISPR